MATSINYPAVWAPGRERESKVSLWNKLDAFTSGQEQNHTLWFFLTLITHGILILPVPAVLIYYFNAPVWILAITMTCFFANLIANMGGAGIKTTIFFFLGSLLIHIAMVLAFIL